MRYIRVFGLLRFVAMCSFDIWYGFVWAGLPPLHQLLSVVAVVAVAFLVVSSLTGESSPGPGD